MTIAILATGDEIVIGDTLNTTSQQIAHILASEGFELGLHITCGDNEAQISQCIQYLSVDHRVVIITGGLGPTSDDRTRYALASVIDQPLVEHPDAINHIQYHLRRTNFALTVGNRQQALFPSQHVTLLANPNGTAMGCYCTWHDQQFFLLPGPPRECLPMFQNQALALLSQLKRSENKLLKWRVFGVAESEIAQQIDDALKDLDCETGYRLETPYVECKVRCAPELIDRVKQRLDSIISPHIIASPEKKASQNLRELIERYQIQLSIQDNVTGGVLQTLLQSPSNHHLLTFNNQHRSILHFELNGLAEYWQSQENTNLAKIMIHYYYNALTGKESHTLPYRSSLVVQSAAEWLSFRLVHLINQLHQRVT